MSALYYHDCIRWIVQCLFVFWTHEMVMMTLPCLKNFVVIVNAVEPYHR